MEPSVGQGRILDQILAFIFTIQIARAYRKGIYRRYRTYEKNDSKVKGRIDVARQIRLNPIFNGKIAYSYREYTIDNDMNRMVLTAYTMLQKKQPDVMRELEKKNEEVKEYIDQLKTCMHPASRQEVRKLVQKEKKKITHAIYSDWEDVRKTACLILRFMGITPSDDENAKINGVLINMNWVWEQYLVSILREKSLLSEYILEEQKTFRTFFEQDTGKSRRELRPDLVIYKKGDNQQQPLLIIDAKYKNTWSEIASGEEKSWENAREDCFQILSYMYLVKCNRAGIFCPQARETIEFLKKYNIFENAQKNDGSKDTTQATFYLLPLQIGNLKLDESKDFKGEMEEIEEKLRKSVSNYLKAAEGKRKMSELQ